MTIKTLLPEIERRQSPLIFTKKLVEPEKLAAILEAARWAPSSFNHQPWRYLVANEKTALAKMHKGLSRGNFWAKAVPVILIALSKPDLDDRVDGKDYYLYDTGLSMMSLVIEAQHQGLATHQMIGFSEKVLKGEFEIPPPWRIIVVMAIGYKGKIDDLKNNLIAKFGLQAYEKLRERIVAPKSRKAMKEIVNYNEFKFKG